MYSFAETRALSAVVQPVNTWEVLNVLKLIAVHVSTVELQVAVDGDEIYRFERQSNGHLVYFDQVSESDITAVTADPTGDYVV